MKHADVDNTNEVLLLCRYYGNLWRILSSTLTSWIETTLRVLLTPLRVLLSSSYYYYVSTVVDVAIFEMMLALVRMITRAWLCYCFVLFSSSYEDGTLLLLCLSSKKRFGTRLCADQINHRRRLLVIFVDIVFSSFDEIQKVWHRILTTSGSIEL